MNRKERIKFVIKSKGLVKSYNTYKSYGIIVLIFYKYFGRDFDLI